MQRTASTIEKLRKNKRIRLDDLSDNTSAEGIIEPKSEIADYGESSNVGTYGSTNVDYVAQHKVPDTHSYDDAGPNSVPSQPDQWIDEKHFLSATAGSTSSNNASASSNESTETQRCKTKNYKALEPCSCPLCARVYSNVSNLRQHMRLIHNPTSVCCPLCQKSFTSDLYLKRHYLSMHGTSTVPTQQTTQQQDQQLQAQQPPQQQPQPTQQQPIEKHVNQPSSFHIYGSKRDYADLQSTATAGNILKHFNVAPFTFIGLCKAKSRI